jgi:CxxC motif-containing protein (DUF1111 family)
MATIAKTCLRWGALSVFSVAMTLEAAVVANDPGVRGGPAGAGEPLAGLTASELAYFTAGQAHFTEVQSVQGTIPDTEPGLGPRFNLDSCAGCHAQPAVGGSSPFVNPQVAVAIKDGAKNTVPFFVTLNGPVREARFKYAPDGSRDGGVHNLYTIAGRSDAPGCRLSQPDFATASAQDNVIFRIPTPTFGAGLIEAIPDEAILANMNAAATQKRALGIRGRPNRNANDGTITRFGWKAQNKSLMIFAGEAYNVEQGVTNELFPNERDQTPGCNYNATPESGPNVDQTDPGAAVSDVTKFALFMRALAPAAPAPDTASIVRGRSVFTQIGCAYCHTPSLTTGSSSSAALSYQTVALYSDLLLHKMGSGLADDILQGLAGPDEFRTAPLWGLGQRIFFLHDGRTTDLIEAIDAHASTGSEANAVVTNFKNQSEEKKQDLLNFLRSL